MLEIAPIACLLQSRFGNDPDRSVRSHAVDADNLAPIIIEADDAKHRISGLDFKFGREAARYAVAPRLFGDAVDRIDAPRFVCADQSVQRHRGTKACDISAGAGRVVFKLGRDLPRVRLDAVARALQQRLFQVAIAQPSDRGYRDRDQRNHRDGKPGCERHFVFARPPVLPGRTAGRSRCYGALRAGSNTAGGPG